MSRYVTKQQRPFGHVPVYVRGKDLDKTVPDTTEVAQEAL